MSDSRPGPGGIFTSLRRLLDNGLALAQNRVELFAVELREEKCRLVEIMLWAAAVVALAMMTLSVSTILIVLLFWETARIAVLLALSLLYLLATLLVWRGLRTRLNRTSAFSATLGEIGRDRACLGTES